MSNGSTIHFVLTDEYLVVANTGRPFSPAGLLSICGIFLSDKEGPPFSSLKEAEEHIKMIRENNLEDYKKPTLRLQQDIGGEKQVAHDYSYRVLFELMQNAHDAAGDKPVGYKGLGFKAVLSISKMPSIHSGYLHCKFDPEGCFKVLQDEDITVEDSEVPVLRLPFEASGKDEKHQIQRLIDKYDTVIVLPLKDEAFDRLSEEWERVQHDISLLLFLPHIKKVIWDKNGDQLIWMCSRSGSQVDLTISSGNEKHHSSWKIYGKGRSALAIPLDANGIPQPFDKNYYRYLRVFFPTRDFNPFPFLLHVDVDVDLSRNHVHPDGSDDKVEQALKDASALVCELLSEVTEPGLWLDLLRPRINPDEMGKEDEQIEKRVWESVITDAKKLSVPGTDRLTLESVRLCPNKDDIPSSIFWYHNCLELWSRFKYLLTQHRPGSLTDLPFLPPAVDSEDREQTVLAINPGARISAEELCGLELLPVEDSSRPVAPGRYPLFLPPETKVPKSLESLSIHFLSKGFVGDFKTDARELKGEDAELALKDFLCQKLGVSEYGKLNVIERVVLPVLEEGGAQPDKILEFILELFESEPVERKELDFDLREPVRKKLAELCPVPVRGGGMRPAIESYAGHDWTGDKLLEQAYGEHQARSFLESPPEDEKERERREKLYRWLGVGWCPKVLDVELHPAKAKQYKGPKWEGYTFPVGNPPSHWNEHCRKNLRPDDENEMRKARLRQDWMLDGDESALRSSGAFRCIADNWSYYNKYKEAVYFRSNNMRLDNDDVRKSGDSYLAYLLKNIPWIPVKESESHMKVCDVFLSKEILKALPGFTYTPRIEVGKEFSDFVGIRSGWYELNDADWHRWIERTIEWDPVDNENQRKAIEKLYEAALEHWFKREFEVYDRLYYRNINRSLESAKEVPLHQLHPWEGPIWAVEHRPDGSMTWKLKSDREDVFYVDRPDLNELRLKDLWTFPKRLDYLEFQAEEFLRIKPLSKHLSCEPESSEKVDSLGNLLLKRRDERLPHIRRYISKMDDYNEEILNKKTKFIKELEVQVLRELKVNFLLNGKSLGSSQAMDCFYDIVFMMPPTIPFG